MTSPPLRPCPRCIRGALLPDHEDGRPSCLNCGWRPNDLPPFIQREQAAREAPSRCAGAKHRGPHRNGRPL